VNKLDAEMAQARLEREQVFACAAHNLVRMRTLLAEPALT